MGESTKKPDDDLDNSGGVGGLHIIGMFIRVSTFASAAKPLSAPIAISSDGWLMKHLVSVLRTPAKGIIIFVWGF